MNSLPLSEVTIITTALGVFFLLIAFYKSIFHKRRSPTHISTPSTTVLHDDNQPVKLSNPFKTPDSNKQQTTPDNASASLSFYPAYPKAGDAGAGVSAFKPFTPLPKNDATNADNKNETDYLWE